MDHPPILSEEGTAQPKGGSQGQWGLHRVAFGLPLRFPDQGGEEQKGGPDFPPGEVVRPGKALKGEGSPDAVQRKPAPPFEWAPTLRPRGSQSS